MSRRDMTFEFIYSRQMSRHDTTFHFLPWFIYVRAKLAIGRDLWPVTLTDANEAGLRIY